MFKQLNKQKKLLGFYGVTEMTKMPVAIHISPHV